MKITKIEQQKKRQDRYSIYVGDEYAFSLSESQLATAGLGKGQELSPEELKDWQSSSEYGKAYDRALKYLAIRPRSQFEMSTYLDRKDYEPEIKEKVLKELKKNGYLDDNKFAEAWVSWRMNIGTKSRQQIQAELIKKRVPREITEQVLASIETEAELENLKQLIATKQKQSRYQEKQKLMAYLARKGFNYGLIKQAFEELDLE
ncbi:MAG: RecX family transcriptional regulator [Candidatus Saccharimonadales bacterium]